jgi:hypothetical protein
MTFSLPVHRMSSSDSLKCSLPTYRCRADLQAGLLVIAAALLLSTWRPSYAEQADEAFLVYAVDIDLPSWRATGIYLGKGLFVTAAHVIGRGWLTRPKIVVAGQQYPASVIKEGSSEGTDLTLLAVNEALLPMRLALRRNPLCTTPSWPGQEVVTVTPEAVVHSHIISPMLLPRNLRDRTSVIGDVATTGNSGSGVFDAQKKCLLGIMSQKISQYRTRAATGKSELHDIAKYFVPAATIVAFVPAELRP